MTQTGNIRNMGRAFPAVALALAFVLALALIIAPGGAYGEASAFQDSADSDSSAGGAGTMDQGQVVTFPGPNEVAPSPFYTVDIRQGERTYNSFTYISLNQFPEVDINSDDTSWTTFEFSGKVTVVVTAHHTTVDSCRILPSRRGVKTRIDGNRCEFDLSRPGKFSVEINGDIRHPLLVFADPIDTEPVPEPGPDVIYFGPGYHDAGRIEVQSNQTVYIAGGAYVKGYIDGGQNKTNVTIRGKGILSGEDYPHKSHHSIEIMGNNTKNVRIEGITIANSSWTHIRLWGNNNIVRNVKMISWYWNTDGVLIGDNSLIEDNFFKLNDDAIKLYHSNMTVRNNVIWQLVNGAPIQLSWNVPRRTRNVVVSDLDVIRVEHRTDWDNKAVFNSIHGGTGHLSDYLFENIYIENADFRLVKLTFKKTQYSEDQIGWGNITDLTFRNIYVTGEMKQKNIIQGIDEEHGFRNITFENVIMNNRPLSIDDFVLDDENSVKDVRVMFTGATISGASAVVDPTAQKVAISGSISSGAGQRVTVRVVDPDGNVVYADQTTSGSDGAFAFQAKLPKAGVYEARIGGTGVIAPASAGFFEIPFASTIIPTAATFDKNANVRQDVAVRMSLGGNTLLRIKNGDATLAEGDQYTVSGEEVRISKEYLDGFAAGTTLTLTFQFSAGPDAVLTISVIDTTDSDGSGEPTEDPAEPGEPSEPGNPTDPGQPADSEEPAGSGQPDDPGIAADPTAPGQPGPQYAAPPSEAAVPNQPAPSPADVLLLEPTTDPGTNIATATVDADTLRKLFDQAEADASGVKTVSLRVPKIEGAASYHVQLPKEEVASADGNRNISIETEWGTITVPGNMLRIPDVADAKQVGLSIGRVDKSSLSPDMQEQIGDRPVIELRVLADGEPISWRDPSARVTVTVPYAPTEEELQNPEHLVVVYIDETGQAIPVPSGKYDPSLGGVTFTVNHFSQFAIAYVKKTFSDLADVGWARKAIEVLASKGIIEGVSPSAFAPENRITRADYIILLVRTLGLDADARGRFDDVKPEDYFYDAVGVAKALGIADGVGNNRFDPDGEITRQDMMVLTARALEVAGKFSGTPNAETVLDHFADKREMDGYAADSIALLVKERLIEGDGERIRPLAAVTRAEAAMLMYRIYNK